MGSNIKENFNELYEQNGKYNDIHYNKLKMANRNMQNEIDKLKDENKKIFNQKEFIRGMNTYCYDEMNNLKEKIIN